MPTEPQDGEGRILSPAECEEIRQREQAATPGPWGVSNEGANGVAVCVAEDGRDVYVTAPRARLRERADGEADAGFVAHARTDVPNLLATVEARDRTIEELRRELEQKARPGPHPVLARVLAQLREERATMPPLPPADEVWATMGPLLNRKELEAAEAEEREELRIALEHTANTLAAVLAGKPVRDADEVLERARILTSGGSPDANT